MCCPRRRTWSGVKYSWIVAVMSVTWRKKIWAIFFGVVSELVKSGACLTCFETHWFNTLGHSWICYGIVMVAQWDCNEVEKLIVVAWAIWSNRNECRNGGVKKSCQALLQGALEYLDEYQAFVEDPVSSKQPAEVVKWMPPL